MVPAVEVAYRIAGGYQRVDLGVPRVVIHPAENPAEFDLIDLRGTAEAEPAVAVPHLPRVIRRYRGHEVRVDQAAFHQVHGPLVRVIAQPDGVEEILRPGEPGRPQHLRAGQSLVAEVVDGVADPLIRHRLPVLLIQQDRNQAGLPVVAVDDVGALARVQPPSTRASRADQAPRVVRPVGRSTLTHGARPAPLTGGSTADGMISRTGARRSASNYQCRAGRCARVSPAEWLILWPSGWPSCGPRAAGTAEGNAGDSPGAGPCWPAGQRRNSASWAAGSAP